MVAAAFSASLSQSCSASSSATVVVRLQSGVDLAARVIEVRGRVLTIGAEQVVALVLHAQLAHVPGDVGDHHVQIERRVEPLVPLVAKCWVGCMVWLGV